MPSTYTFKVCNKETGEEGEADVTAHNEEHARNILSESGLLVESLQKEFQLVWYGKMVCTDCFYTWKARKNTPPARCPTCSKSTAEPDWEPPRETAMLFDISFFTNLLGIVIMIVIICILFFMFIKA